MNIMKKLIYTGVTFCMATTFLISAASAKPSDSIKSSAPSDTAIARERVALGGEMTKLLEESKSTFEQFKRDKLIPEAVVQDARCVAIFPGVKKAALLVGGRHGDGVASCRNDAGKWSTVAFVDLTGASFGAQLGATTSNLVFAFMTERAQSRLEKGKIAFGADLSAAFGSADKEYRMTSDKKDVLAFSSTKGFYVGASLEGTKIQADSDEMQAFYNEPIEHSVALTTYTYQGKPEVMTDFIKVLQ